jgi:hypothetical protein
LIDLLRLERTDEGAGGFRELFDAIREMAQTLLMDRIWSVMRAFSDRVRYTNKPNTGLANEVGKSGD